MASAAEEGILTQEAARPFLTLHVFGSSGVGKKLFKKQWFDSSHSRVLSEIADMHIRIQREWSPECSELAKTELNNHAFLVIYRPDSEGSISYARDCLEKISETFSDAPPVTVVENHFEPTFKPQSDIPKELPPAFELMKQRSSTNFWRVSVVDSVHMLHIFDHMVIRPLIYLMDEETRAMAIARACQVGKVQVLKLLVSTVEDSTPVTWLPQTMATLEQKGVCHENTPALMAVARYAYNLDQMLSLSTIVRLAETYPKASLHLLDEFCHQSKSSEHFMKSGLALIHIPPRWVANSIFTHVDLTNNLLTFLPEELFQLSHLKGLKVSHNCLESIPSILKWNCPQLRDLDLSYNRLVDVPYSILEGKNRSETIRGRRYTYSPSSKPEQQKHETAAQRILKLTGYNLYPCIHSISRVNITHNPSLRQLPEWVCLLPHLTLLEMQNLPKLTTITPHLSHCRFLCIVKVDVDNLVSPPPEEAQRGTRAIMAYLRCKLKGCTPYRHVRMVLIGEHGSGKSTLFTHLMGWKPNGGPVMPHMEVASFKFQPKGRLTKDPKLTFHVMKFAGDDVYRCTHQCFLTHRSIYLCLWDVTKGEEGLRALCSWLRSIQACAPGSPTFLIGTHRDRRPTLSGETIRLWEEEIFGDVTQLSNRPYAAKYGLPPILKTVLIDCTNKDGVDRLMTDVYDMALQMRHYRTKASLLEDMVPQSYQNLQGLVELKMKGMRRDRRMAPVLRHEEFVDYIRSLTICSENLEEDQEELALATRFLHEAGTIVHFQSQILGMSDLYFLDPQWLFNTLAKVIKARLNTHSPMATIQGGELPQLFERAEVPQQFYNSFLGFMESFDILVSLDMEKNNFLIPSLLPDSPPPHYPSYDPTDDCWSTQYIQMDYLPNGFFPRLLARVLIYIRQLSGQLLAVGSTPLITGGDYPDGGFLSVVSNAYSSFVRSFTLDRLGYVCEDELGAMNDEGSLRDKIWALSNTAMTNSLVRQRALTEKLVSLSQPILRSRSRTTTSDVISEQDPSNLMSHVDNFASYVFWKKGIFVEFPCGTKFWLEACDSAVAVVIYGALVPRVKVLSFITSCLDVLVEECYAGLEVASYSPCPSCLKRFWNKSRGRVRSPSFLMSSVEIEKSHSHLVLDEFNDKAVFTRDQDASSELRRYSFSGSSLRISRSESPSPPRDAIEPEVVVLEKDVTLFPLPTAILQSMKSDVISCPRCELSINLRSISPHVLLVDFSDKFLVDPKQLQFTKDEASELGRGGFAKVFKGIYRGEPVAVKVFDRRFRKQNSVREYQNLREELTIMTHLSHPRVISLVGVCLRPLCMVMKMAPQGSLSDHLDLCPHGLDYSVAHRVLFQLADGIRYLHSLYIIHRDIKPSNVLVWSLHPERGVDVRLTDYGVSQFSTPSGLWRQKGTEEYMAPELFHSHGNQAYDEKVDIFSFALVLHLVVTGRKLFATLVNKREQLRMLYNQDFPKLSQALGESLEENYPPSPDKPPEWLEGERHPAARTPHVDSCHSVCMQQLVENCLAQHPSNRPSAHGICSRLLVCPGGRQQVNFITSIHVDKVSYSPSSNVVVALNSAENKVMLLPVSTGMWHFQPVNNSETPYNGDKISCFTCVENEIFLGAEDTKLIYSLRLPTLTTAGHISHEPLPEKPLCMFPYSFLGGTRLVVGMAGGMIAIFSPPTDGKHLLESKPFIKQIINHPGDDDKTPVSCGVYNRKTLWCGCGRYLIGLDPDDFLMKFYKPVIREHVNVSHIAAVMGKVWMSFEGREELIVCSTSVTSSLDTISCHGLLGFTGNSGGPSAIVTHLTSSLEAVWVGTQGGHLIAFDPLTTETLLVHRRHTAISTIVCLRDYRLVTFGKGPADSEDTLDMFNIWTSYVAYRKMA